MQNNADIFYRITGGLMVLSSLWNVVMAFIWFISFIWVCIGAFWIIPGLLALVNAGCGVFLLATGKQVKPAAFAPCLGLLISLMNLNIFAGMIDLIALGLGIFGFTQNVEEEPATAT